MKSKKTLLLKIIVSLILLALVLYRVNFEEIWHQINRVSLPFVIFALVYYTGCQWLSCIRWQIILKETNQVIPMAMLLKSYFAGMFLNTFLPSSIGGDVYRVYCVAKMTQNTEIAFVSVFLERITGVFALLAIAIISLPPAFRLVGNWEIISLVLTCTVLLLGAVLLMLNQTLLKLIEPLLIKFHLGGLARQFAKIQILLRSFPRQALAKSMGLSIILQLLIIYYYYLIAQQLNIPISYLQLLVFIPIIVVATLLPISLGGLGLKEGLLAYLFSRVHLSLEHAVLLSLTITVLGWILSLPGGLILLLDTEYQAAKNTKALKENYSDKD